MIIRYVMSIFVCLCCLISLLPQIYIYICHLNSTFESFYFFFIFALLMPTFISSYYSKEEIVIDIIMLMGCFLSFLLMNKLIDFSFMIKKNVSLFKDFNPLEYLAPTRVCILNPNHFQLFISILQKKSAIEECLVKY